MARDACIPFPWLRTGATTATFPWDVADDMVAYLIKRADDLTAHAAEAELERIVDLIEAYEAKRWPDGKIAAGNG